MNVRIRRSRHACVSTQFRRFPGIKVVASLATAALIAGAALSSEAASAGPSTTTPQINIVLLADGQAPFDAAAGQGNDTGASNAIVRANQYINYKVDLGLNDPSATSPTPYDHYTIHYDPLPIGFRWDSIPTVCYAPHRR